MLDVLINNAGIALGDGSGLPSQTTLATLRAVYETNVFGVVAVTNAMLPLLRRASAARIVNVSSELGSITSMTDPAGPMAAMASVTYPSSKTARAAARLGDSETARSAINAASDARDRGHEDDVVRIGGEFGFSRASQHYYAGSTVVEIPQGEVEAIAELERSIELYAVGPESGEDHSEHYKMAAHVDLATARLRAGQLDAAGAAAQPVLSLPPNKRVAALPARF